VAAAPEGESSSIWIDGSGWIWIYESIDIDIDIAGEEGGDAHFLKPDV